MAIRKLKPRKETKKKMHPMKRSAFHKLLDRVITTPSPRPAKV